jgi:hypothetical protein
MATTTKSKEEQIFIGINNQVIELTGKDKEVFIAQRDDDLAQQAAKETELQKQKTLKLSAYTKLGLTKEEIDAIL